LTQCAMDFQDLFLDLKKPLTAENKFSRTNFVLVRTSPFFVVHLLLRTICAKKPENMKRLVVINEEVTAFRGVLSVILEVLTTLQLNRAAINKRILRKN
jgi:hypothetical protein